VRGCGRHVEDSARCAEPIQSEVTDADTVDDLAQRIETMVTNVLEIAADNEGKRTTRRG